MSNLYCLGSGDFCNSFVKRGKVNRQRTVSLSPALVQFWTMPGTDLQFRYNGGQYFSCRPFDRHWKGEDYEPSLLKCQCAAALSAPGTAAPRLHAAAADVALRSLAGKPRGFL